MKNMNMTIKSLLFLFVLFSFPLTALNAQCTTIHDIGITTSLSPLGIFSVAGDKAGQTFTATSDGVINSISLGIGAPTDPGIVLDLRISAIGSAASITGSLSTEVLASAETVGGAQILQFILPTPFPVSNGEEYAFEVENVNGGNISINVSFTDTYPDGLWYAEAVGFTGGVFGTRTSQDYNFEIEVCDPERNNEPIPTMGQWGIILFGLLVISLSVFYGRQKQIIE